MKVGNLNNFQYLYGCKSISYKIKGYYSYGDYQGQSLEAKCNMHLSEI